jgi:E3 ubiquitin-protein ligase SHPRH
VEIVLNLRDSGSKSNEPRYCIICQTHFSIGVFTTCGHQFCKECLVLWFKINHNCPVCKKKLGRSELHDISIKPMELKVLSEATDSRSNEERRNSSTKKLGIYSEFSSDKLAEIRDIELSGPSYTTKADTLIRHILWLREADPGAKSIIFSQ